MLPKEFSQHIGKSVKTLQHQKVSLRFEGRQR